MHFTPSDLSKGDILPKLRIVVEDSRRISPDLWVIAGKDWNSDRMRAFVATDEDQFDIWE